MSMSSPATTTASSKRPTKAASSGSGAGCLLAVVWLLIIGVGVLLRFHQPIDQWAATLNGGFAGDVAALLRLALRPPVSLILAGVVLLAALALVLEGIWAAVSLMLSTIMLPKTSNQAYVRIRIPRPTSTTVQDTGMSLLRALHEVLPPLDGGPWLSLVLSARPDQPVDLGVAVVGGMKNQRKTWLAAIRKAVKGINAQAVVDACPDPLAAALTPGRPVQVREFRVAYSIPQAVSSVTENERIDTMGPLVAALQVPAGVTYTEAHLTIRPKRDTASYEDAYTTTIRAVAIAEDRTHVLSAWSALDQIGIGLSRYRVREPGQLHDQRIAALSRAGRMALLLFCFVLLGWLLWRSSPLPAPVLYWLSLVQYGLLVLFGGLVVARIRNTRRRQKHCRLLVRAPRLVPPKLLAFWSWWTPPLTLEAKALSPLYHLPTASLGAAVRWLSHRIIHPPSEAFIPPTAVGLDTLLASDPRLAAAAPRPVPPQPAPRSGLLWRLLDLLIPPARHVAQTMEQVTREIYIPLGYGLRPDGTEGLVGVSLHTLRKALAVAAPPGTGKTRFIIRVLVVALLLRIGMLVWDGKGDDRKGFCGKGRRMLSLADELRMVLLDPRDSWTVSLNPMLGINLDDELGLDEALSMIEAIFARIDPENWKNSPRMAGVLRKVIQLVLYGELTPTLAHAKQALEDEAYRARLLPACQERNLEVASFWQAIANGSDSIPEQTLSALRSRFDILLDTRIMRRLFSLPVRTFFFEEAIANKWIVFNPVPEDKLGARAGPIGMLTFQLFMRAAYARPGSDMTRENYIVALDEFDFLVRKGNPEDIAKALTKVRSFGVAVILLHQFLIQLEAFCGYVLGLPNRLIMRVDGKDAQEYARVFDGSEVTAQDIANQSNHHYVRTMYGDTPIGPYSARPLEWLDELEVIAPSYDGADWQNVLPSDSATPQFDAAVRDLVYGEHEDWSAIVQALADANEERWQLVWTRWCSIALNQREYIFANPGCIPLPSLDELRSMTELGPDIAAIEQQPDKLLSLQRDEQRMRRQLWLSRLRFGVPPILADAMYARIRIPVTALPPKDRARFA